MSKTSLYLVEVVETHKVQRHVMAHSPDEAVNIALRTSNYTIEGSELLSTKEQGAYVVTDWKTGKRVERSPT